MEAEHVLIELDPLVHLAFLDVADDVVDRLEADGMKGRGAVAFGVHRREAEDEGDLALPQYVARLVLLPRLEAGVGDDVEAEGVAIEVRRLAGVADEEADVIDAAEGESVFGHCLSLKVVECRGPDRSFAPEDQEPRCAVALRFGVLWPDCPTTSGDDLPGSGSSRVWSSEQ